MGAKLTIGGGGGLLLPRAFLDGEGVLGSPPTPQRPRAGKRASGSCMTGHGKGSRGVHARAGSHAPHGPRSTSCNAWAQGHAAGHQTRTADTERVKSGAQNNADKNCEQGPLSPRETVFEHVPPQSPPPPPPARTTVETLQKNGKTPPVVLTRASLVHNPDTSRTGTFPEDQLTSHSRTQNARLSPNKDPPLPKGELFDRFWPQTPIQPQSTGKT